MNDDLKALGFACLCFHFKHSGEEMYDKLSVLYKYFTRLAVQKENHDNISEKTKNSKIENVTVKTKNVTVKRKKMQQQQ